MKKTLSFALVFVLTVFCFAGCSGKGGSVRNIEGDLPGLVGQIYENADSSVHLPYTMEHALTEEGTEFVNNVEYFIGAKGIPFEEGIVSEAAIGATPYSLVLLRMKPDADVEAAKRQIKEGVDLAKWICANATDIVVDNIGDLVLMVMWNDEEGQSPGLGQAVHQSFLALGD